MRGERIEEHGLEGAEDGAIGAYGDGERQYDHQIEPWTCEKAPPRVLSINVANRGSACPFWGGECSWPVGFRGAVGASLSSIRGDPGFDASSLDSLLDGLHKPVIELMIERRVADEPRHHDEQHEQEHGDEDPQLDGPVVAESDAPHPFRRPPVDSSWSRPRRLRPAG